LDFAWSYPLINLRPGENRSGISPGVKPSSSVPGIVHFFDRAYEGTPPWEIGRPQPEFVSLEDQGEILGRVLDVGCGTGENALFYANRGHATWGIDFAPLAIQRAERKNVARGGTVHFTVASALDLGALGERFDTVTDCGMFHTFLDEHRPVYARSVASVLRPGGRLFVLCFSEREPNWGGPRRVTGAELRATFADGWKVRAIRPARFETTQPEITGHAWLASFELRPTHSRPTVPRAGRRVGALPVPRSRGSASSARGSSPPRHERSPPHRP
jgi:SAM-dependent methyltransferase